jgi:hypothetical protein
MKLSTKNSVPSRTIDSRHGLLWLLGAGDVKAVEQLRRRLARTRCVKETKTFEGHVPRHD